MERSTNRRAGRSRQNGLSLVELMVGITVGLFVVAAAATLVAGQLSDNRRLMLEVQLQQDLRASMDIISRQLRRAGATNPAAAQLAISTVPGVGGLSAATSPLSPTSGVSAAVNFAYNFAGAENAYGFKLEDETIKTSISGTWQELTDRNALKVTGFSVTPANLTTTELPCAALCPGGGTACWPTVSVRDMNLVITAEARSDSTVRRTIRSNVRVRNDQVNFNGAGAAICP